MSCTLIMGLNPTPGLHDGLPGPDGERTDGSVVEFDADLRIDTPGEADYYRNGGILQYVLRSLVTS